MNSTNRTCEYCHKSIDHRGPKAKTCSNTCKQYAMEVRQGKREPIPKPEIKVEPIKTVVEPVDRKDLDEQLAKMNEAITKSNDQINEVKELIGLETEEGGKMLLAHFRLREAKNDFLDKYFYNDGEISGNDLLKYSPELIRYPFKYLEHPLFETMGNPSQPFLAVINGERNTGKTILSVLISNELMNYLDAKVLHIVDFENKNKAVDYYQRIKSNTKNLLFKYAKSYTEIVEALRKDNYEFLILDSIQELKLNYENLKSIKKEFPKLSIFCVIKGVNKLTLNASNISFETEAYSDQVVNGAFANVFVEGMHHEAQKVDIFLNQSQGFSISL